MDTDDRSDRRHRSTSRSGDRRSARHHRGRDPRADGRRRSGPDGCASFLTRGINALTKLATAIDERTLGEAIGADSDLEALVRALQQPEAAAALREAAPLLPARLRGLRHREWLLADEGGTVSAVEVAALPGLTRQAVDKRRRAGTLLGLPLGRRGHAYPIWQFKEGGLLPGLGAALPGDSGAALLRSIPQ